MNPFFCTVVMLMLTSTLFACKEPATQQTTQETTLLNDSQTITLVYPEANDAKPVSHCIIWLHGLGATANDFPPIVPHLGLHPSRPVRFIFPQAPDRPITINGGYVMPGWYDIKGADLASKEDRTGLEESRNTVEVIIQQQIEAGIPSGNIILAGFSQGGAVAYYTATRSQKKLAGLLALSTYLVFDRQTAEEHSGVNKDTPIFASHGTDDPVVPVALGQNSVQSLQNLGYTVEWQTYGMQHEVSLPQIQAIGEWINGVFSEP